MGKKHNVLFIERQIEMAVYEFESKRPLIGEGTYISESADVIGNVIIGKNCYIGPGARIKGDYGKIVIGDCTSIQENCILHARPDEICTLGNYINFGHGAIGHNCNIKDYAVIGMGAIISDYAMVGIWGVVGEGAVVKQNQIIGDDEIAVGVPAKVISKVTPEYKKEWMKFKEIYVELANKRYKDGLKRIS